MISFVADEDFDNRIVRGLMRRNPDIDIIRIQDTHLAGADDTEILEWVFQQKRIVLTHDVSTMTRYAYERINAGQSISGIIEVAQSIPIGKAIDDILIIATCSSIEELENQILFLPL